MNGSYLFVTPIENLVFDDDFKKKEINIGDVLFVKRKRLPYIRKRLGLKKTFSKMTWLKKANSDFLKKADVYALIHYTGDPQIVEYKFIKNIQEALNILSFSQLGYSKRRSTSIPTVWGIKDLFGYHYMSINLADPNRFLSRELSLLFYAATNDSLLVLLGFKNTDSIRSHFLDSPDHLSGCLLFAAA